jgi:hypothetical protein
MVVELVRWANQDSCCALMGFSVSSRAQYGLSLSSWLSLSCDRLP